MGRSKTQETRGGSGGEYYHAYTSPAQSEEDEDLVDTQQPTSADYGGAAETSPFSQPTTLHPVDSKTALTTTTTATLDQFSTATTSPPPPPSPSSASPNRSLQKLVLVAAATAATLGYDVGIMAAAIQPMEQTMRLNGLQKEAAMGSLNFVAAMGALLGGRIANDHGRKCTVKVCCWIFVVGTILMAAAPGYWSFLLGRIVTGMGVGVSFVAAPVYLSEVAPTEMRGRLNTVFDVAINGGILLGYVFGFLVQLIPNLKPEWKWRLMLIFGVNLPILVIWNLGSLPESPRWLVMKGQSAAAGDVLRQISSIEHDESPLMTESAIWNEDHNQNHPPRHLRMLTSMEEEVQMEKEDGRDGPLTPMQALCRCKVSAQMRFAMALGFWQQITGTEAVLYYSADFLLHAGLQSPTQRLLGNCFVGLCKLSPELIGMHYVDTFGRRPLMLLSAISLVVSIFLLSTAFFLEWSPMVVVLLLCAIMASFSIGLGPFSFLVASEMLGLSERATGMTLCAATNRLTSGTVALTAVSMYEALGSGGLFAIYGLVGLASLPFYYFTIPETAGQSLEELSARRGRTRRAEVELNATYLSSGEAALPYTDRDSKDENIPTMDGTMA